MAPTATQTNIYGDVESPEDIRKINRQIREQMERVRERDDLTELKKRSDYLCALAMAPSWRTKFGSKIDKVWRAARDEDRKTTDLANRLARQHGWEADYGPWGR